MELLHNDKDHHEKGGYQDNKQKVYECSLKLNRLHIIKVYEYNLNN